MQLKRALLSLVLLPLFVAACEDESVNAPVPTPGPLLNVVSGDAQVGSIARTLVDSPTVIVVDRAGKPLSGTVVEWRVIEGGGMLSAPVTTTGADGRARVAWTLGEDAGRQLLMASVRQSPAVTFRADAVIYYTTVAAGARHTCALDAVGNAYCWGEDRWGQLGNGNAGGGPTPTRVAGGYRFTRIAAGYRHTCALTSVGEAYCWGENGDAQLGDGSQSSSVGPVAVSGTTRFTEIAPGGTQTCALSTDGGVYCWGSNSSGQVGATAGTCTMAGQSVPCARTPVRVALSGAASAVGTGEQHSCAVLAADGRAYCWGNNVWGEVGTGVFGGVVATPQSVAGAVRFRSLGLGSLNTCGVATTGLGYCWGMSRGGLLANGNLLNFAVPERIASTDLLRTIDMGETSGCGLTEAGAVHCWGAVTGDPAIAFSRTPIRIPTDQPLTTLSVGGAHVCGMDATLLWCWGSNAQGQLGVQNGGASAVRPVRVGPALPIPRT